VDEDDDEGRKNSLVRDPLGWQHNSRGKLKFTVSGIDKFSITDRPGLSMLSRMRHTSYVQNGGKQRGFWIHRGDHLLGMLHTVLQTLR
jgi:hypothetical protein